MVVELVFWASLLGVLHTYVLYPLALVFLDALRAARSDVAHVRGGTERRRGGAEHLPEISLVVSAWNEAGVMGAKLANSVALDYPVDRLEILIGSDGSDDGTDEIVSACGDPRVRLVPFPERSGKASVLNRTIAQARGELVVLSDANTMIEPGALRKLARHFADPAVGAVCGNLRLHSPGRPGFEEGGYWTYESFLKLLEGRRGVVQGANGGLYAIRRRLFRPLPAGTIVDDFVVSMRCLQAGKKVVYEPEARAHEETTQDYAAERGRRARIAAGNFQALGLVGDLLHPRHGLVAFAFFSHKLLRWSVPALLAAALVTNALLLPAPFYAMTFAAQLLGYGLAAIGLIARPGGALGRIASMARYFVEMNAGLVQGFARFVLGRQRVAWQRTRA